MLSECQGVTQTDAGTKQLVFSQCCSFKLNKNKSITSSSCKFVRLGHIFAAISPGVMVCVTGSAGDVFMAAGTLRKAVCLTPLSAVYSGSTSRRKH